MWLRAVLPLALLTMGPRAAFAFEPPLEPTSSKAPGGEPTSSKAPASGMEPTSSKAPASGGEPTSSKAPPSTTTIGNDPIAPTTLETERGHARSRDFNRHGVGVRGGVLVIPTWILARYLDTHGNALCRGDRIGDFAEKRGLLKTQGCNFYIAAEYIYRQSRVLDIVPAVGYLRLHTPDSMWLDKGQFALKESQGLMGTSGADYTEVKMDLLTMQVDFIARAPIVVRDNVELGIGGGGGLGLGVVFGGVWQTPLGDAPAGLGPRGFADGQEDADSCTSRSDLGDFTRCTPRYDPDEDGADPDFDPQTDLSRPDGNPGYAHCGRDKCNVADLNAFGYRRKNDSVPPVFPIVNLALSARVIIKDTFGITLTGGWNTGFYFGGSLNYFFGKQFQKHGRSGPAPTN